MTNRVWRRAIALAYGVACHGAFVAGVGSMAVGLLTGMAAGRGTLHGGAALVANTLLLAQFPLLHSTLLSTRGRRLLGRLAPRSLAGTLAPTTYALVAGLQIALTFVCWSPTGPDLWRPTGWAWAAHCTVFAGAWAFLGKALLDAGLGLQTGWIGWTAAFSGRRPTYPRLPVTGLFARCRQPIYLGFALVLWTGPTWTADRVLLASVWSVYCALGPLHKERRFAALYGEEFEAYRRRVPYLVPRLPS